MVQQAAIADSIQLESLSSFATVTCKTFFFRNPETTETLVCHMVRGNNDISPLLPWIKNISAGQPINVYATGGNLDDTDPSSETAQEIERVLETIRANGVGIGTLEKVTGAQRKGYNASMNLADGLVRCVEQKDLEPYLIGINPSTGRGWNSDRLNIIYNGREHAKTGPSP